ncbi:MAG: adenosylcobinamide-GDP ribazoletransferase [Oscillospiraceae bacterium]|nr:adenosylcobinamide-GDP ribazoletransferase [Oscillospiraceae bacterium]
MNVLKSLCVAFSMYSKIPMPKINWDESNMKYALCFFPLVGVVIGAASAAVFLLCEALKIGDILRAALMTALPVMISGGIHIDGFLDTCDALSSYGDREKKLEILKDPHTGAFAIIGAAVYFILYLGFMSEINSIKTVLAVSVCFVLSRSLSGLALCLFKCAKNSGLLYTFKSAAQRKAVTAVMCAYITVCAAAVIFIDLRTGIFTLAAAAIAFLWYRHIAYSKFGGTTGDVAGYFLCVCELLCVIAGGMVCVL